MEQDLHDWVESKLDQQDKDALLALADEIEACVQQHQVVVTDSIAIRYVSEKIKKCVNNIRQIADGITETE